MNRAIAERLCNISSRAAYVDHGYKGLACLVSRTVLLLSRVMRIRAKRDMFTVCLQRRFSVCLFGVRKTHSRVKTTFRYARMTLLGNAPDRREQNFYSFHYFISRKREGERFLRDRTKREMQVYARSRYAAAALVGNAI